MIRTFFATLAFMSRLPVPYRWSQGLELDQYSRGIVVFPWVGLVLGAIAAAVFMLLAPWCGTPLAALFYVLALAACKIAPGVKPYLIPSHFSAEKGATIALNALGLEPYLHMGMRLGEGSGAALAMQLVDAACAIYTGMGTLAESNIEL